MIQTLILHNQVQNNLLKYNVTIQQTDKVGHIYHTYYRKQIHDIICFCQTKKVFPEYCKLIEKEYEEENIVLNEIFETVNNYDNIDGLKQLAIS